MSSASNPSSPSAPAAHAAPSPAVRLVALRLRLVGPMADDRLWGWLVPLAVALLGGVLRFWRLGDPHALVFDETYYVKDAYSYLRHATEMAWPANSDGRFVTGHQDIQLDSPEYVVHPPVGKWMIAAGMWLFGTDSSFGWRFSAALVGTCSILMVGRIGRRLFGSTLLGGTAALLMAVDGLHFVHSRTALLDVFVMFWMLAAFGCLLIDRDRSRELLARRAAGLDPAALAAGFGPGSGWRPWRLAAGVCLGLCMGTKWSGLYVLAVFGVMTVLWDAAARRALGVRRWFAAAVWRDGIGAFLALVPVAVATYVASWAGWFANPRAYDRQFAAQNPDWGWGWVPAPLRSLWHYHESAYSFHVGLHTPHPYMSNPWSWLVMGRPTSFYYESYGRGARGCTAHQCSSAVTSLGTPLLWWAGVAALVVVVFCWLARRDWRAGAILAGYAAAYLPWFAYQGRTIFTFYAVAFEPFVVLAVTYALGLLMGRPGAPARTARVWAAGGFVALTVLCFAFFYPVQSAQVIPYPHWQWRMWFPSWV